MEKKQETDNMNDVISFMEVYIGLNVFNVNTII